MSINEKSEKTHSDQTRERLLTSGLNLLAAKGYRGAVTREIAAGAGVTEMTLYRHFRSKDELFAAAINVNGQMVLSLIPEPSGDIKADLVQLSANLVTQIHAIFMQLIRIVPELQHHNELQEQIDRMKHEFQIKLISLLNHYKAEHSPSASDTMRFYMFTGPVLMHLLDGNNTGYLFDCEQHVKLFLEGIYVA